MIPEMMAIQCNFPKARPTTLPARWDVGKTENAVGARTKAKKRRPPIHTTSDSNMRKRRKDIAENYVLMPNLGARLRSLTGESPLFFSSGAARLQSYPTQNRL